MKLRRQLTNSLIAATVAAVLIISGRIAMAAPADDIRAAVQSSGAKVESADARAFTKSFSAVLVKANEQDAPKYVAAAIKLRPDLAGAIAAAALRAHRHPGREMSTSCDWVNSVIAAAVGANHSAAASITKAAIAAEPSARKCIVAAAIAAAPDQRVAIEQAAQGGSGAQTALFRPAGIDAGNINSAAIGTINPANVSAQGAAVSPENQDRQTICHNGNTLTLPRPAAEAHLRQHPGDYPGACH